MSEQKYGPNTADVEAYLALLPTLTKGQWERMASQYVTWGEAWDAEFDAAWHAAEAASHFASRDAALDEVWEQVAPQVAPQEAMWAALAIIVRDLITQEQFDILTAPMRAAGIDFDALTPEGR